MTSYPPPGQPPAQGPYPPAGQYPPPQGEPVYPTYPAQPGPPPPPSFAPQSGGHPADPPRVSPPPPPVTQRAAVKAPPVAWLIPLAALLAVIGAFTPWFDPTGTYQGQNILQGGDKLYSWKDGKVGLIAPIALVVVAVSVISLLQGKARGRFASGPEPVKSVAKFAIGAGVAAAVCLIIAWFMLPGQYHFTFGGQTYSWSKLEDQGVTLGHGPQIGYWLTAVAAVVAIAGGVATLLSAKPVPVAAAPLPGYPQQPGVAGQPGYPQQAQQQTGYQPPSLEKSPPTN